MKGTTVKIAMSLIGALALPVVAYADGESRLPLHFEINRGQHAPDVRYSAQGRGYGLLLTATETVLVSRDGVVRMSFPGANEAPIVSGIGELPGKANYLRGRNPDAWRTNIPTFARVAYRAIYPAIDLVFYGNQQQLEYDFIVSPGGDPELIALRFDGVEAVSISAEGDLVLRVGGVEFRQRKPVVYQTRADREARDAIDAIERIDGRYVLRNPDRHHNRNDDQNRNHERDRNRNRDAREVGFEIGAYDRTRPLIIDPVLVFSSYLGGAGNDTGERIAVDLLGNAYLTGTATLSNGNDVYVAKVNRQGNDLVYLTYVGGTGSDAARDIAINFLGEAYVTGVTDSTDFPAVNAVQPLPGGLGDAFVLRLSAGGDALLYSTYLGGSRRDNGAGIAVDFQGNAYVTGTTASLDFPTTPNAFQPEIAGIDPSTDAFVTKLNPSGGAIVYSTYLGGGEPENGTAIAVNAKGNAFVTGVTGSGDFPVFHPFQPTALRGVSEAFVTKLSVDGSSLVYSSNLGGNRNDAGLDIAVDFFDRAVVVGATGSTDFPTVRALQSSLSGTLGAADGFITIVNSAGSGLVFSTYFGGTERDEITSVALDLAQNVSVAGRTFSTNLPVVRPVQAHSGGGLDAFVARIDPTPGRVAYATYLGGEGDDEGRGVAVDVAGSAYVIGTTASDGFPVVNALQPDRAGGTDAFFAKIAPRP